MTDERRQEIAEGAHRIAGALDELGSLDEKIAEAVRPIAEDYVATMLMWRPAPSFGKSRRIGPMMAT
jgi:hypothetical protein